MKTLAFVVALFASVNAYAVRSDDSWSAILADEALEVRAPLIPFYLGQGTAFVPVFEICAAEEWLMTTVPVKVYLLTENGPEVTDTKILTRPKTSDSWLSASVEGLLDHAGGKFLMKYGVPVYRRTDGELLFTKSYALPECN